MKELANIAAMPLEDLREEVMESLVQRFSNEGVSMEDFERRTALATKAATKAELLAAIEGLPEEAPSLRSRAPVATSPSGWKVATETPTEHQAAVAIFGGAERKGVWRAPRHLETFCLFGGAEIDLRKAVVPREGLVIGAFAVFGGVDIIIPPDMRVEVSGMGIFGGFDHKQTDAPESAPLVRVEGLCVFGGASIKIKA